MWPFTRRAKPRVEPGPGEMLQAVRAEFVGNVRAGETRFTGLKVDTVLRVSIEKLVKIEAIPNRHSELHGIGSKVLRFGDMQLICETDGERTPKAFRDIVVKDCHRYPATGRLTGTLIADQIVPTPAKAPVHGADPAGDTEEPEGDATGADTTSREDSARSQEPSPPSTPERSSASRPEGGAAVARNEIARPPRIVSAVERPETEPSSNLGVGLDRADERHQPVQSTGSVFEPIVLLDGVGAGPDITGVRCVTRVRACCSATGRHLAGMVDVRSLAGQPVLDGRIPLAFTSNGFTLIGPEVTLVIAVQSPGYRRTLIPIALEFGNGAIIDLFLEPQHGVNPSLRAVLKCSDASLALQAHLVHVGVNGVSYHVSADNPGRLEHWPFARFAYEQTSGNALQVLELSRQLGGTTYGLVYASAHRDQPESTAIAKSDATVLLYDDDERVIGEFKPSDRPGNLWCAFALSLGEPIQVPSNVGATERVSANSAAKWAATEPLQSRHRRQMARSDGSNGQAAGHRQRQRRRDWWVLLCAAIGLALTALIAGRGLRIGALVMLAVTVAVLYGLWEAGYPLWPQSLRPVRRAATGGTDAQPQ